MHQASRVNNELQRTIVESRNSWAGLYSYCVKHKNIFKFPLPSHLITDCIATVILDVVRKLVLGVGWYQKGDFNSFKYPKHSHCSNSKNYIDLGIDEHKTMLDAIGVITKKEGITNDMQHLAILLYIPLSHFLELRGKIHK